MFTAAKRIQSSTNRASSSRGVLSKENTQFFQEYQCENDIYLVYELTIKEDALGISSQMILLNVNSSCSAPCILFIFAQKT